MSTPNLLRRYMDILAEAEDSGTRRVTPDGKGGYTGGFQPAPYDPNRPVDPKLQAKRQARDSADAASKAWFARGPKTADGIPMPASLNPAEVEKVLAGADPRTVIFGRAHTGAFGSDPTQYRALAQQWLEWISNQPAKFDPLDPKWD